MSRSWSDCCHYDEGYDDGLADGKNLVSAGDGLEPMGVVDILLRASRALYRADPLSVLALDCEQAAECIVAASDVPGAIAHLAASARSAA